MYSDKEGTEGMSDKFSLETRLNWAACKLPSATAKAWSGKN